MKFRYFPTRNYSRRLQLQLSGLWSELVTITVTSFLGESCRIGLQERIPLRNSQELFGNDIYLLQSVFELEM